MLTFIKGHSFLIVALCSAVFSFNVTCSSTYLRETWTLKEVVEIHEGHICLHNTSKAHIDCSFSERYIHALTLQTTHLEMLVSVSLYICVLMLGLYDKVSV